MEKRLLMFMVSLFLCAGSMFAQTKISGTVLSQEDGQPVLGAAVEVVGTSTGLLHHILLCLSSSHQKVCIDSGRVRR